MSVHNGSTVERFRSGRPFKKNPDSPQARGLLAWYAPILGPHGGQFLYDYSGNNRNAIRWEQASPSGFWGWKESYVVDGTYAIDCGNTIPFDGNNVTMVLDATFRPGWDSGSRRWMTYYDHSLWSSGGAFGVVTGGGIDFTFTRGTITDYSRQVFIVSRSGNTIFVHHNGVRVYQNTSFSNSWTQNGNCWIARGQGFIEQSPLELYDARFYGRGISEAEALAMYNPQTRYDLVQFLGDEALGRVATLGADGIMFGQMVGF